MFLCLVLTLVQVFFPSLQASSLGLTAMWFYATASGLNRSAVLYYNL